MEVDQTVELLEVVEDLKVTLVDPLLDHLEDFQVVEVVMVVLVILVEQVVLLMNKMVGQAQILVLHFKVYLTLVYMLVEEVGLQEIVNLKEEKVDLVEAVMEKEELIKTLDRDWETKQRIINATCKNKHAVEILVSGGQVAVHW